MKFVILLALVWGSAVFAENLGQNTFSKVAVVFSGGDKEALRKILNRHEREAIEMFKKKGYRVAVLDASNGKATRADFLRLMSELKNVKDLRLDFLGHGMSTPFTPEMSLPQDHFPPHRVSDEQREAQFQNQAESPRLIQTNQFMVLSSKDPQNENGLGLADFRGAIQSFQANNPGSEVTLYAGNCFSGTMAYELTAIPHFRAFTATSPTSEAPVCEAVRGEQADHMQWMMDGLRKNFSDADAHFSALRAQTIDCGAAIDAFPEGVQQLLLPRNSLQGFAQRWCRDGKSESSPATTEFHQTFEKAVLRFYRAEKENLDKQLGEKCVPALEAEDRKSLAQFKKALQARLLADFERRAKGIDVNRVRSYRKSLQDNLKEVEAHAEPGAEDIREGLREDLKRASAPDAVTVSREDVAQALKTVRRCVNGELQDEKCQDWPASIIEQFGMLLGLRAMDEENVLVPDCAMPKKTKESPHQVQERLIRCFSDAKSAAEIQSALKYDGYNKGCDWARLKKKEVDAELACAERFESQASSSVRDEFLQRASGSLRTPASEESAGEVMTDFQPAPPKRRKGLQVVSGWLVKDGGSEKLVTAFSEPGVVVHWKKGGRPESPCFATEASSCPRVTVYFETKERVPANENLENAYVGPSREKLFARRKPVF